MITDRVHLPDTDTLYSYVDAYEYKSFQNQPPCIGLSANLKDGLSCIANTYVQAVLKAGGMPVLIPITTNPQVLAGIVDKLDGLIMTGGGDINPLYCKEEPIRELQDVEAVRDEYDLILLKLAADRQLPILGICRGHQLINAAFGGTLYQDIYAQHPVQPIKHSQLLNREYPSHSVTLTQNSKLSQILGNRTHLYVNSFHHQAVKEIALGFLGVATAADGINEGMEAYPDKAIISVQWHPEAMAANDDETMLRLFEFQVKESQLFKQAKALHQKIVTIDSHTDTPMLFPGAFNIGKKEGGKVNLPLMEEGHIDAAVMVAYLPQGKRDEASLKQATAYATEKINQIKLQEKLNPERMGIAYNETDLRRLKSEGKRAIFIAIENGYAIGKDISNLEKFKAMGVTYITLCHNGDNDICDSHRGAAQWNGLSAFGKDVVKEMNRLGILIDISHAGEKTIADVLKESAYPIVASHSSARALCNHTRNLTNDQIRAIASKGGVIQVCMYKGFINSNAEKASLTDVIEHIEHIIRLVGVDHVGIGSDFDGDGEVIGCKAANELINITTKLLEKGYSEKDIEKIWGGNFLRVLNQVQNANK